MEKFAVVVRLPGDGGWEKVGDYFDTPGAAVSFIENSSPALDPSAKVVPVRVYGASAQGGGGHGEE